jgi:hypothetical protein
MKLDTSVKDKKAKQLFVKFKKICQQNGSFNQSTARLLNDLALLEQLKQSLLLDIQENGIKELFINGSQQFNRENKSVAQLLKVVSEQRKTQLALKLDNVEIPLDSSDEEAEEQVKKFLRGV